MMLPPQVQGSLSDHHGVVDVNHIHIQDTEDILNFRVKAVGNLKVPAEGVGKAAVSDDIRVLVLPAARIFRRKDVHGMPQLPQSAAQPLHRNGHPADIRLVVVGHHGNSHLCITPS